MAKLTRLALLASLAIATHAACDPAPKTTSESGATNRPSTLPAPASDGGSDAAAAPRPDGATALEGPEPPVGVQAPSPRAQAPATRHPAPERLVAIGDVHGDLNVTRRVLRLAGAIGESDEWIGGGLVVVQTGDQLDRGDGERAIVDLFERLRGEAEAAGGAVIPLNGNHEIMNAQTDMRYVTPGGFTDFGSVVGADASAPDLASVPVHARGRVAAFRPGGPYAKILATRNVAVVVGDSVFVHGGITPRWASVGLDTINAETRAWLAGDGPEPEAMRDQDGPIWSRRFATPPHDCEDLATALETLGVRRMVVGHTRTPTVRASCDERLWQIDVGMASAYAEGPPQALEIVGDQVRVLSEG